MPFPVALRERDCQFFKKTALAVFLSLLWTEHPSAAETSVVISLSHAHYFLGESFTVHIIIAADGEAISVIKPDRGYDYNALHSEVFDPNGNTLVGGPPNIRPPATVRPEDLVSLPHGGKYEADVSLFRRSKLPGWHKVRVTYNPFWRKGAEFEYEGRVLVIGLNDTNIESRRTSPAKNAPEIEVLKVKAGDEHWLIHRNSAIPVLSRIEKIGANATFTSLLRPGNSPSAPEELWITVQDGSQKQLIRIDAQWGRRLPGK